MKKLFLFVSIITMAFGLMARDIPNVIVHKSNGGLQALFNCYREVTYTPGANINDPANLDCSGTGWTFCRIPSMSFALYNPTGNGVSNPAANKAIECAINQIIEYSENTITRGTTSGSKSVTVAVPTSSRSGSESYFVKGTWKYNQYGEGDLFIYVSPVNDFVRMN